MTAQEVLSEYRRAMAEVGEDIVIRRYSGPAGPNRAFTDTVARARVVGYQPRDLVGGISQGDRKAIVLVDTLGGLLPIVPGRDSDDKAVVRGKLISIIAVDDSTRRIGGILIALELQVRG